MVKTLFLITAAFVLVGCGTTTSLFTKTKTVLVPVPYCPAPPDIQKPSLPVQNMTEQQKNNIGELAKYYKATAKTLILYSKEQEKIIKFYKKINKDYEEYKNNLIQEYKNKGIDVEIQEK